MNKAVIYMKLSDNMIYDFVNEDDEFVYIRQVTFDNVQKINKDVFYRDYQELDKYIKSRGWV